MAWKKGILYLYLVLVSSDIGLDGFYIFICRIMITLITSALDSLVCFLPKTVYFTRPQPQNLKIAPQLELGCQTITRSSRPDVFLGVLGCSPVNLLYNFRTPFPRNTTGWLLLYHSSLCFLIRVLFCRSRGFTG